MNNNVLIIKRGAMGDILMSTPMIRQLKINYPHLKIDYCVSRSFKNVLINNRYLNKIIDLPDVFFTLKGILLLMKFLFNIRHDYDYVFILGKSSLFNIIIKLIMRAKLVGFARGKLSLFVLDYAVNYDNIYKYQGIYYLELLKVFKLITIDYTNLDLDCDHDDTNVINFIEGDYVVITNSGGNNQFEQTGLRMLPDEIIIPLIKAIANKYPIILLGSNLDYSNYERYINNVNSQLVYNCAGLYNISQSINIIKNSKHFLTTDCGAMHLGIVANASIKMSCIFGPSNYYHCLPPNFVGAVFWCDFDDYDIDYQLYGKIKIKHLFFATIDINTISMKVLKS